MKYNIKTPSRKRNIRKLVRKNYSSLASSVMKSENMAPKLISEICQKIKFEMKDFSRSKSDSVLQDMYVALKQFSWETIFLEVTRGLPTLVHFLSEVVPRPKERIPLICMISCQLLKARHQHMSLVQRALSTMLYGNGTKKQVHV